MNLRTRIFGISTSVFLIGIAICAGAADLQKATPERAGFSKERLDRIAEVVQPYVVDKQMAGAVIAVARKNKLVYFRSFGSLDSETGKPMRDDALFRIASMSKPVTSVAVMMLYEDGRLLLDDPISKFIPEFKNPKVLAPANPGDSDSSEYITVPAKREVTIRDLLTHTSGMTYRFWNKKPIAEMLEQAGVVDGLAPSQGTARTVGEAVKKLAKLPLLHHPGEVFEYGLNTDVLGYLVEVVSGMPLDQFLKQRIFDPLRMRDTQFYPSPAQCARLASLYVPGDAGTMVKAKAEPIRWGQLVFDPAAACSGPRTYLSGGAGLTSTAADYLRFLQTLLNGGQLDGVRVLSRKSVELLTVNHIGDLSVFSQFPPTHFGNLGDKFSLGFGLRSEAGTNELGSVGEYTWAGIYNTRFWVDPKEQMIVLMMGQMIPRKPEIESKLHAAVYQAIVD